MTILRKKHSLFKNSCTKMSFFLPKAFKRVRQRKRAPASHFLTTRLLMQTDQSLTQVRYLESH